VKRVLTAIVLLPVFILAVLAPRPVWFHLLVALGAVLCALEFQGLAGGYGARPQKVLASLWTLSLLGSALWPSTLDLAAVTAAGFTAVILWTALERLEMERFLPTVAATFFGGVYVGLLLGYLALLRTVEDGTGSRLIFFLAAVIWTGDSAAFYAGSRWGRHKLSPRVSPKKSWEGAAANVAGGLLAACVCRLTFFPQLGWRDALVLGVLLSVAGQLGDAFESLLKRGAGVKDSSGILPGHGGFLDRLDSIFFNGPILYYYHQAFLR
jgi:phosphatidate cytidylyltransferase